MATPDIPPALLPSRTRHGLGFAMALVAAVFWGLSALAAQSLFDNAHLFAGWLVSARMGVTGLSLLGILWWRKGPAYVLAPVRDRHSRGRLLIFSALGLWAVQYSYLVAIHDGNAATATLLQYTAPAVITLYVAVAARHLPTQRQVLAVLLSLIGTWLLVSGGQAGALALSAAGLFWGLLSSASLAFYTLYPGRLLREWGPTRIVGWGMLIGAVLSQLVAPLWRPGPVQWSWGVVGLAGFVVFIGTLAAFWLYLASLRQLSPPVASLVATAEPLVATAGSVLWLGVTLHLFQEIGAVAIVCGVAVLAMGGSSRKNKKSLG